MTELVVSAFFSLFFNKLTSEALNKIACDEGIESELKKLKMSLDQIQALLNDASQKEATNEFVRRWLNGLQHLAYDIDDVLDDLETEDMEREFTENSGSTISKVRQLILTCCTNFSLSSRMHGKLDDIVTELQELEKAKTNLGLSVITNEMAKVKRHEASLVDASVIVGREGDKNAFVQKLLRGKDESSTQNFSIVPIVGMGGVGKTALARLLYDEKEVKDHFQVRAWVCVSDEFDIFSISKVIYQSVTRETKEFTNLNMLQEAVREKLKDKLFLIVLDDVWSESYDDWDKLVGPFLMGAPGSRIIMTTRKEQLLRKMGYTHLEHLPSLSHDDAMRLFSQHALGVDNFDSHPILKPHGEGFVKKCDGLPLALRVLGRLLRTKTDEEEWKVLLNSEIWRLGNGDEIVLALRLSYNDLSASLKLLFAYCSLFPKDYVFDKEELILLWMAEGFLKHSTTSKSMKSLGHEYFEELLSRSFFQHSSDDESLFMMHDLMNDLAISVAGDFFLRLDIGMKEYGRKDALTKLRHMSFVCEHFMVHERFMPLKGVKNLRTVLTLSLGVVKSWEMIFISNKVINDLLQELPLLRVLSLSNLSISEVPEVVGSMKHLRYLNLSRTEIQNLPENVCNLYNLQTLIVSGCKYLFKLPENFSKLKNLQHFDIRDTPLLKKMPLGIGELKRLQTLSKIIIGGESGFSLTKLKNLQNLHGKVFIEGLGNVENAMDARETNFSQKRLTELVLDWGSEFNVFRTETQEMEILNELKPHNGTLEKLRIESYRGIEFPNWVGDPSFCRLTRVSIDGCEECTSLPRLGQLPSLKELFIGEMSTVKVVGLDLLGTGLAFPSLEILRFESMSGWEEWSTNSGAFPCLQELHIEDCPNLVQVSLEELPSLRVLKVIKCGHGLLKSLVDVASSVTVLEIDDIWGLTDKLWRGVIGYLGTVEEVSIRGCDEIRYLWESEAEASKVLMNLKKLDLGECENLVSLGEKEEDDSGSSLTSFRRLRVWDCNSLEHCNCPDSLESLMIHGCDSVTSVTFPTEGEQKLKSLSITDCKKLSEEELGGREKTRMLINSKMQMLGSVIIHNWPNLKSINELSCFIHLTWLTISECPSMDSFPDHELPNLTSLTHLTIQKCKSMDASFPRGIWPPKLSYLGIGGLKKPISEWGPQNFPTSLVSLRLYGGLYDDVKNFDQLSHLFPSTLTYLEINGFQKLKSISMGLQHLTSLQRLYIFNCPKVIDLPERLLPSLLVLWIEGCPNLKERIRRGGSYWPHISLIPCFEIDSLITSST
ncbi:putative disease resistance protein At3g14460 [Lactuca sativa]|uniref:NBS-LRR resistance-like protein n=1 Tax=Lactuca sativa TaxID=4236 RepID=A0A9R1W2D6_LACSA|nr:putative disease resistance protein At3g14460 [Lactuca sativa]KAJ0214946.1 hypothetical protein LSAT_V11C300149090 [Lactuca sativa]